MHGAAIGPRWALLAAAGSLLACASGPPIELPSRVLLAPVSFNQGLPEPFAPGVETVREEIAAQLKARGVEVHAPPLAEFHDVWVDATRDIGTLYDPNGRLDPQLFDAASRALIEAYRARGAPFDVMLFAYIEVIPVRISGWKARWDGVDRRVRVDREGIRAVSRLFPNGVDAPCVSLRVIAYAADGARIFERRGGLEIASEYAARNFEERHRDDLFEDAATLREGVGIALAPMLQN